MTEEINSAMISGEAGKIIASACEWHKGIVVDLEKILKAKKALISATDGSGNIELTDERDLTVFHLGIKIALMRLGDFPIKIEVPAEEEDDE